MKIDKSDYSKCIIVKKVKHGYVVECKLGLWGVQAPTESEAHREAVHYFQQYYSDGEYTKLLNNINN